MGPGQPRVIIWTTLVVLPYTMLHTKFQGHWSIGSGEEDFLRFLPYMGMAAMLVMWPRSFEQLFFPKGPGGCIWNLVAIGPVVSEEKLFEIVDGRRTDGRRTDGRRTTDNGACLYYKLPLSLRLRWAKKLDLLWLPLSFPQTTNPSKIGSGITGKNLFNAIFIVLPQHWFVLTNVSNSFLWEMIQTEKGSLPLKGYRFTIKLLGYIFMDTVFQKKKKIKIFSPKCIISIFK